MFGFEVTESDIDVVLRKYGIALKGEALSAAYDAVMLDVVSNVAMSADYTEGESSGSLMDCQLEAAHDEIATQLVEENIIPLQAIIDAGNTALVEQLASKGIVAPA
jgi:hypothetical protein